MRLVLIHGRGQGGKDAAELEQIWLAALGAGFAMSGRPPLPGELSVTMPFYGDLLDELTAGEADAETVSRGADGAPADFESRFLLELAQRAGVTADETRSELGDDIVQERGPQNWHWVLATGRALSKRAPWLGSYLVRRLTKDVAAYLTRPDVRVAVNQLIAPCLVGDEPTVVVSHSLGTIVAYVNLIEHEVDTVVPLLVTLGSPLGIDVVKAKLPRPLRKPGSVGNWFNASDLRDPVALFPRLERDNFPAEIDNLSDLRNPEDNPHGIAGYLSDPFVAGKVSDALER